MSDAAEIELRPAHGRLATETIERFLGVPNVPGGTSAADALLHRNRDNQVVAVAGDRLAGACLFVPSPGRCALILTPRMQEWDTALAGRLLRGAAALAVARGALLVQAAFSPERDTPLPDALAEAGMEHLALLSYQRRSVAASDAARAPELDLTWKRYRIFRHKLFAEAIAASYVDSLDCPGLRGLRSADDAIDTHKSTGRFTPKAWHVALEDGEPVGVVLVNDLSGRGELVYLGVAAKARGRGVGRALLNRAIADTARMDLRLMGLAVDVKNEPAMRLYRGAGFREIKRRETWFVPGPALADLRREGDAMTDR